MEIPVSAILLGGECRDDGNVLSVQGMETETEGNPAAGWLLLPRLQTVWTIPTSCNRTSHQAFRPISRTGIDQQQSDQPVQRVSQQTTSGERRVSPPPPECLKKFSENGVWDFF